ncbi:zinc finger protein 90-like isoform X7 [Monodelphis domestica]|nr:zinc finger protein 90-like isoform X7 [Monodelphis domestica]
MAFLLPLRAHQESVTFKDAAADFTQEEWGHLCPSQKSLNKEVMLENYRNLVYLGLTASKPDVIYQLEQVESSWVPEGEAPAASCPGYQGRLQSTWREESEFLQDLQIKAAETPKRNTFGSLKKKK